MMAGDDGYGKWRENMMEGEDGLRTVESLRGRLLAERVTSRAAKEDSEFMGNKLIELERQLKLEIESRNKAEKKLKFLMKKLESLKLSPVLDHSSLLENIEGSSSSSITSSGTKEQEEQKPGSQTPDSVKCNSAGEMAETIHSLTSVDLRNDNPETGIDNPGHHSNNNIEDPSPEKPSKIKDSMSSKELITEDLRQASPGEKENNPVEYVDNRLALVPVSICPTSQTCEAQINNENVRDVLAALRHAREQLQNSMGRRDVIYSHSVGLCGV